MVEKCKISIVANGKYKISKGLKTVAYLTKTN